MERNVTHVFASSLCWFAEILNGKFSYIDELSWVSMEAVKWSIKAYFADSNGKQTGGILRRNLIHRATCFISLRFATFFFFANKLIIELFLE